MRSRLASLVLVAAFAAAPGLASHYGDATYDQPVWFEWEYADLDVVLVPPNHGQIYNGNGALGGLDPDELDPRSTSYLAAGKDGILSWNAAVARFGPDWLRDALVVRLYVAGFDELPPLDEVEVVVISDETKGPYVGLAIRARPCVADVSKLFTASFTPNDFHNLVAQEYAHCLGIWHVEDEHPRTDVMSALYAFPIGRASNPRECPSNLNVKGLEGAFARALGQPPHTWGTPATMPVTLYEQDAC